MPRGAGKAISVAAGTPAHGVEGFVLSHREALAARRVVQLRGEARAARASFPELALEALMVDDVEAARRFAARELGPLAAADDATVRLASTLAVFLDEGASFVRAARRLGVHTNTVTYRVHRAEELLGHPVNERQLELRVALRLARLGPSDPAEQSPFALAILTRPDVGQCRERCLTRLIPAQPQTFSCWVSLAQSGWPAAL